MTLGIFGFRALWSPYFFVAVSLIIAAYFLLTVKYRYKWTGNEPLSKKQGVQFTVAIVLLYIVKGSPADLMGHLAFYAHMIQMAVLYLVIPPLMIVGIPNWLWTKFLNTRGINLVFHFFTKPLIALILFIGFFSIYHIPMIFDVIKTNMWLHAAYTVILFIMAVFMWWPLMNRLEEYQSLNGLKKVGYIFASSILLTPACALIIFADEPMYATFSDPRVWSEALKLCVPSTALSGINLSGPEMFNSMSLKDDQMLGGILMKMIQEIVYGIVLAQIFFSWYKKEQEETPEQLDHLIK